MESSSARAGSEGGSGLGPWSRSRRAGCVGPSLSISSSRSRLLGPTLCGGGGVSSPLGRRCMSSSVCVMRKENNSGFSSKYGELRGLGDKGGPVRECVQSSRRPWATLLVSHASLLQGVCCGLSLLLPIDGEGLDGEETRLSLRDLPILCCSVSVGGAESARARDKGRSEALSP